MAPDDRRAALAQVDEALGCILGEGERLVPSQYRSFGEAQWEALDPLQTGMAVQLRAINSHLQSPTLAGMIDSIKQASIAMTMARRILSGEK